MQYKPTQTTSKRHSLALAAVLCLLWGLWSGHGEPFLLSLGALSVLASVALARRFSAVDEEAMPLSLVPRLIPYGRWLLWEIVKANWDVARVILSPQQRISPSLIEVTAHQQTALGRTIYANSITLTPGTISVALDGEQIRVHSLTRAGADGVLEGSFDRQACWLESGFAVCPEPPPLKEDQP